MNFMFNLENNLNMSSIVVEPIVMRYDYSCQDKS